MTVKITFKGSPMDLAGRSLSVNSKCPDFKLVSQDLKDVKLSAFAGKIKVVTSFPSLDTPVCDLQVKEFNKRAVGLAQNVIVIGVSRDLPFAQRKFCESNGIKNVTVLSDYKYSSFGFNCGLHIKQLNLLARSVLILDADNIIRYKQVVSELTGPPDYKDALDNLSAVVKNPELDFVEEFPAQCKPCEGAVSLLPQSVVVAKLAEHPGWQSADDKKITKEFTFADYAGGVLFVDMLASIADEQGHHPAMTLSYKKVKVTFTTHNAGGLTNNDFIMAKITDEIK